MPSWMRSNSEKPSEKDLRRCTMFNHAQPEPPASPGSESIDGQAVSIQESLQESPRRNRRVRDSVVSLSAINEPTNSFIQSTPLLEVPEVHGKANKHHRFSLLKFRHASDSHLSKTAREHAEEAPPIPMFVPPSIITTAPTQDNITSQKRRSTFFLPRRHKSPGPGSILQQDLQKGQAPATLEESGSGGSGSASAPPPYGDESSSALALPVLRMSDSSRSDESSGEHGVYATTTTTTHTVSTTTTFFKIPRRKKGKGPLFPLPPKVNSANASTSGTPRLSSAGIQSGSPTRQYFGIHAEQTSGNGSPMRSPMAALSPNFARSTSRASQRSEKPKSSVGRNSTAEARGRSSTSASHRRGGVLDDEHIPTPAIPQSTRTSTSTAGRPSLAGLFNISRLRQSSEPMFGRNQVGPGTPVSTDSKHPSLQLPREPPVVIPERQEGDTPAKYLARIEEVVRRGALVALVSKTDDEFMKNVLRSFMRRFSFFEEPLDIAVRKMLMHVELPKETQHIDRTLQSFADRYQECNPGIFSSSEDAYFCAFSILVLHTDAFNRNNKHKMQKTDYIKNAREDSGVASEILECFYDNIVYTPFIHLEDDITIPGQRIIGHKASKKGLKGSSTPSVKKSGSGPIDPYALILDGKLDNLRPPLNDILSMDDPFTYIGTASSIDVSDLNRSFFKYGVIQILSSRSRPDAFMNQATITNPADAQVGIVDMKVTKVGILWRKDPKKKKTRSPWQEWGAILTGSQLYFFRNTSWVKSLMHQYEVHHKFGRSNTPVVFKPPLEHFKPDFLLSTDEVVAVVDSEYRKHKNAFFFTRQTTFQEVFLAESEADMNDWLAKINYAATFRTAGVRMRGIIVGSSETRASIDGNRTDSRSSTKSVGTSPGDTYQQREQANDELTRQVLVARRQIMSQKIVENRDRIKDFERILDSQLRTARHFCVLTPIQVRTRDDIVEGTIRLATNIRWARIEKWRVRCHSDILQMDLDLDNKKTADVKPALNVKKDFINQNTKEKDNRLPFARLGSKAGISTSPSNSRSRPSNQLTGSKIFSMDDIFRSSSRTRQPSHKAKGSWELPPLAFDGRGRSVSLGRDSRRSSDQAIDRSITSDTRNESLYGQPEAMKTVSDVGEPHEQDEHQLLVEAGIVPSEAKDPETGQMAADSNDEDKLKLPELDEKDNLSRVRHSFHRKLQNSHIPSHHRSRKGKESVASATLSEDSASTAESEGLTRTTTSFTVQGKKASVVTFGSEWSQMGPEDRMRARRSAFDEGTKPATMSSGRGSITAITTRTSMSSRPSSSRTTNSTARESLGFVTPTERISIESEPVSPCTSAANERITEQTTAEVGL